ncbi:MAG TPA: PA14 domain-containing protein [Verrucomicrobiae bacterium]|nr:PA14 domain-containing protein [Verrucomicrobiae bacterium]
MSVSTRTTRLSFALATGVLSGFLVMSWPGQARQAVVETVTGKSYQGEVVFTNQAVVVDGTNAVPLNELRRLNFEVPAFTNDLAKGKGNGLLGFYFGRTNFEGGVVVRLDERVEFDWASGEPVQGVPAEQFSVIWSGDVEAPADGDYVFSLVADDIAQLTIGSNIVVEAGPGQRGREVTSSLVPLQGGTRYPLLLKYQELSGNASVKLFWRGPGLTRRLVTRDRLYAKSRLPQHTSELLADDGLLATYYKNPDYSGESFTRVDPQIDFNLLDRDPAAGFMRSRYSVRWQGQLRANFSEVYTFHAVGDEPLRVWVEGRPLIMPGGQFYMTEVRESLPLVAGERYDIRVEGQSTSGNAAMRLMWSSPSTPKNVIPMANLTPSGPVVSATAPDKTGRYPRGFFLRNGSFIALPIERADESVVRAGRWLRNQPISTVNVARIFCQPVSRTMVERIPPNRAGLLLSKGDFADGRFKSIENGQIKITSVLFGLKSYEANKDVLVVALGDVRPRAGEFEVRLQDHSVLQIDSPRIDESGLMFRDASLGACRVELTEVVELTRPVVRSASLR